ncbi:hypothetical protein [Leptolinea tardivitalis]|uniref:Uncharacterized protein n=1 Tax=Leptolinea tardivitalis TaxID=229920 RepID=A0A0P6X3T9_9CHLR|nr:hypothetical protein [Leptolinea tardivitalis]KPL74073.1 hypothetical protein ADM99_02255 [Leptolinea tardivitalis]GAP22721.1 hypothetical protein LTAR_02960 [Leptolinea tardivitalis]
MPELTITMLNREGLNIQPAASFIRVKSFNAGADSPMNIHREFSTGSIPVRPAPGIFIRSFRTIHAQGDSMKIPAPCLQALIDSIFGEAQ